MRLSCSFVLILASTVLFGSQVYAQDNVRAQLFAETDQLLTQVKDKSADLYGPKSYQKAMEYYNDADESFKKGKDLEDIREKLKNANAYFAKAIDACKLGEVTFNAVMIARDDAKNAGAPSSVPDLWGTAEKKFIEAARSLEEGDANAAKNAAPEIEQAYRGAELEAIKANYLSPARSLLKQADDLKVQDYAPKTLAKAKSLVAEVETILQQNRGDADQARQVAGEAKYEAAHALSLSKSIQQMRTDDKKMEDVLLGYEAQFQRVGTVLGVETGFENGVETPVSEMISAIKDKDTKIAQDADSILHLNDVVRSKENDLANLNEQIASMQSRLGTLTDDEKELQRKLTQQHEQESTIKSISTMFTPDEGNVLRDGDNIIIRLYGLTFESGKSDIDPQYYPILTKVQEAIRKFDSCTVKIEGHTDSKGNEQINQALSESRAKAVAEYLMANMRVERGVASEGFGDTKPVATNNTAEGRAKNRRIDVIITPTWASTGK